MCQYSCHLGTVQRRDTLDISHLTMHMHITRDTIVTVMTNSSDLDLATHDRLRQSVGRCLRDVDELVDIWFTALRGISSYQEGLVASGTVRTECTLVFTRLLSEIGDLPVPPESRSVSDRVGHSRAIRGIPLSDLLAAIRLDYRVIWDGLVSQIGADDSAVITACVPRLLDAVERHSQEVTKAYNLTQHGMMQSRQDERRLWFTRLIETDGRNQVLNVRACEVLGLQPYGAFTVFVSTRSSSDALDALQAELTKRRIVAHHYALEDGEVLITQLSETERRAIEHWAPHAGSLATLGPLEGVALVPAAVRLLFAVAAQLADPKPGLNPIEQHWQLASFSAPAETREILRRRYLRSLLELPDPERRLLLDTAESYLSNGSIAETSRALFCHRNTTANRLDHITALTTLDLRRPRDASVFLLAFASMYQPLSASTVLRS